MIKKIINLKSVSFSTVLLASAISLADNADDRYFYIGTELGLSEPVVKEFEAKTDFGSSKVRLKQSRMFGGRIGYSFYPGMMIEISGTHQPKYGLQYELPEVELEMLGQKLKLDKRSNKTKVKANVFTLNWIYEIPKQIAGIKPYTILGAGLARVSIQPKDTTTTKPAELVRSVGGNPAANGIDENFAYHRIKKHTKNYFVWQAGVGVVRDLTENIAVDLSAKMQVINNLKLRYETYDVAKKSFVEQKPIKKTIGVGEFAIGFTFKLPV